MEWKEDHHCRRVYCYCFSYRIHRHRKEQWTSTAIITPPQLGQLADYPTAVAVIDPSNSKDISNDVFANFVSRMSAETLAFMPEKPLDIKPTNSGSKDSFTVSFSAETPEEAQNHC